MSSRTTSRSLPAAAVRGMQFSRAGAWSARNEPCPGSRRREAFATPRSYRPYMDEARLVALARAGEETAVDELFGRVWPLAWHWAFGVTGDRMLADHVAQEAVLRAFRSLGRFDSARPFRPWLKRITVNLA